MPSLAELMDEPGAPIHNWTEIRNAIHEEFPRAASVAEREALLNIFVTTMSIAEKTIGPDDLETFRDYRSKDYRLFLVIEAQVGKNACVETMFDVTEREIAAGRMKPDDELRVLTVKAMAEPHLSRAELEALAAKESGQSDGTVQRPSAWQRFFRLRKPT